MSEQRESVLDEKLILICREEGPGREVKTYVVNECVALKDIRMASLQWRQRYNPELKYFVMKKKDYTNEEELEYVLNLIAKNIPSILYTYV